MRARLLREHDRGEIQSWRTVWDLEFKAAPTTEHDAIRKQVKDDLRRMQDDWKPLDSNELSLIQVGYELAGDQKAMEQTRQDLLSKYPASQHAVRLALYRWGNEHPVKATDPVEKKDAHYEAELSLIEGELKLAPADADLLSSRFYTTAKLENPTPEQIKTAADAWVPTLRKDQQLSIYASAVIGQVYVRNHIRVEQVPQLIREGEETTAKYPSPFSDRLSEEEISDFREQDFSIHLDTAKVLLDAGRELHRPDLADSAMAKAADINPGNAANQSKLLALKANYADWQGRKLDALLLYRKASEIRPTDANAGPHDDLEERQQRLWKELGGTDATVDLWKRAPSQSEIAKSSPWKDPGTEMPEWTLGDLQGATWKMSTLRGKIIFINVWASWCEPCQKEHPYLQKLYDKIKDRTDV